MAHQVVSCSELQTSGHETANKRGLKTTLSANETTLWFLSDFGDDERLRTLRQIADGRRF
ncbi:hypothetical protein [Nostoc sp. ATCC 53789]|uniref:hypothetical protein n=1 Tax=Nostoc sp. ATCC 53789 TaxID=76335 RepID=UPI0011BF7EDD|nr:hypothetical protein [Nostoc sp. ATCC 53789]QHG21110.1 hypothetical protein GJB62_35255 [Nostoc sp. ATCC 53789]